MSHMSHMSLSCWIMRSFFRILLSCGILMGFLTKKSANSLSWQNCLFEYSQWLTYMQSLVAPVVLSLFSLRESASLRLDYSSWFLIRFEFTSRCTVSWSLRILGGHWERACWCRGLVGLQAEWRSSCSICLFLLCWEGAVLRVASWSDWGKATHLGRARGSLKFQGVRIASSSFQVWVSSRLQQRCGLRYSSAAKVLGRGVLCRTRWM